MAADELELAWGYCVHCGDYAYGRYRWPINDRAEAIDQHEGCPFLAAPEEPIRRHVQTERDEPQNIEADGVLAVLRPGDGSVVEAGAGGELQLGEPGRSA